VILFRESMYHVPIGKVKAVLDWYARFLTEGGVFVVRMYLSGPKGEKRFRPRAVMRSIEGEFDVIEKAEYDDNGLTIAVFRPLMSAAGGRLRVPRESSTRGTASSA
jgi:hypothetical protein